MNSEKNENASVNNDPALNVELTEAELPQSKKRLKERYPDTAFDGDKEWEDAYNKAFDEDGETIDKYKSSEESINELFRANPELLDFIVDLKENKMPLQVAVSKHFGMDYKPSENDDDFEAWQTMYNEKLAQSKTKEDEAAMLMKNEEESEAALDKFYEEQGFTDEEQADFEAGISALFKKLLYKQLDGDFLSKFHKARSYDSDIKAAEEAARISARNEQIEKKIEKEKTKERGDGIPVTVTEEETDTPAKKSFYANAISGGVTDFNKLAKSKS
jgi:hypothetical protein